VHIFSFIKSLHANFCPGRSLTVNAMYIPYLSGCDSGFGQALARELDSIGASVFAGCLCTSSHGAKELLSSCSERCDDIDILNNIVL